jgi:hypothetical protein
MYIELGNLEILFSSESFQDFPEMKIFLWVCISIFGGINVIQLLLITSRKKLQPLKGRGAHIMYMYLFGQTFIFALLNLRLATDRYLFNCVFYTFLTFLGVHCNF